MMKKGFALTLMTVAIALVQVSTSHAIAPVISNPGDIVIGTLETNATTFQVFVAPDLINSNQIVTDETPDGQIKWSFTAADDDIEINGVGRVDPGLVGLGADDPTSPALSKRIDQNNLDDGEVDDVEDGNAVTFTFRDVSLSPNVANPGDTGPAGAPGVVNVNTITLFASDCTTFSSRDIVVYSIRGESDGLSGGGPEVIYTVDFNTTDDGWIGGNQAGFGGTVSSTGGLCMTVPAAGSNLVLWISPEAYVELVDNAVYRLRNTATTDQTGTDAIPLLFVIHSNNYYLTGGGNGNNYGGFAWFLDVDGGANGLGRNSDNEVETWVTPNAVATGQWQGGAFTPAADALNDLTLRYDVNDANPAILTQNDSGTICIETLEVGRIDRNNLQQSAVLFNPPIDSSTHFIAATIGTAMTSIDNNTDTANADLGTSADTRVDLIPYDANADGVPGSQFGYQEFNPVVWNSNELVRTQVDIRAAASETDPVDSIFLAMQTTNNELGTLTYTTRSGGSVMVGSASPKLAVATYEIYHHSGNASTSIVPNTNLQRGSLFFFNTGSLFGTGTGGDAVVIEDFKIDQIAN